MSTQVHLPPHAFASIRSWAASVAPGSPAPLSPRRRPSVSSTASRRRPSLVVLTRAQSPTAPAPAADDAFDLTALGYTSVFVHLPKTPTTPSPLLRAYDQKHRRPRIPPPPPPPAPAPSKRSGMRRFRSLSVLRPRNKQAQPDTPGAPPSPSKTTASAKPAKKQKGQPTPVPTSAPLSATTAHSPAEICAATVLKRKRAKYAYVRPPPTLAQELAVMQFAEGGSMEANVRRAMELQAKLAAGAGAPVGVADVYRDGAGGIWWDADEELEYAHLLAGAPSSGPVPAPAWEAFDFEPTTAPPAIESRRTSLSSCDSDLDPARLLPLPEHEDRAHALPDDRVLASRRIGGPALGPVLCLPARPRRPAPHLARAHYAADVDMAAAFGRSNTENTQPTMPPVGPRARGKARRRPPPLTLAPSSKRRRSHAGIPAPVPPPMTELPSLPLSAYARHEFLADSFAPPPAVVATTPAPRTPLAPLAVARVPPLAPSPVSMLHTARRGVRGLFARRQAA